MAHVMLCRPRHAAGFFCKVKAAGTPTSCCLSCDDIQRELVRTVAGLDRMKQGFVNKSDTKECPGTLQMRKAYQKSALQLHSDKALAQAKRNSQGTVNSEI